MNKPIQRPGGMRRFRTFRDDDIVCQGVQFGDGTTVLRWYGDTRSIAVYASFEDCKAVHGHGGTEFRWEDKCCFLCGASEHPVPSVSCSNCGASWEGEASGEPEPEKGAWVKAGVINPRKNTP